jgi:predicted permease
MENLLQDFRYALRVLFHSPRFAATAVVTLTLGLAANVAIFSFVDAALIRPLPYRDAGRLFEVYETRSMEVNSQFEASYPDFLDWRSQNQVFESLAGYSQNQVLLRGAGNPEVLSSAVVTDNFFSMLGTAPAAGRDFHPGEDLASAPRTALLSYAWWQKHFGGRQDVIGRTLNIDGDPTTIIGVLPADFHFAPVGDPDLWLTTHAEQDMLTRRNLHWLSVVGKLKPGVTAKNAAIAMNLVAERLEQQYPQSNHELRTAIVPINDVIMGQIRPILLVLQSAVVLLLLIACANVANLLLARSVARRKEMAIRTALGASRLRLMALVLTEGLVLSFIGGALGLILAHWTIKGFIGLIPSATLDNMPYLKHMGIDGGVMAFALGLVVATGIVFALAPALHASRSDVQMALKDGARASHNSAWRKFASGLVISEVAMAMMLLVGSGLLVKSLYRLLRVDPGFEQSNLLGLGVAVPAAHYPQPEQRIAVHKDLIARIRALPGVESVGSASMLPVSNGGNTNMVRIEGQPSTAEGREANSRTVDQYYFQTLRAQLLQGRWFNDDDNLSAPQRVIVNQTFADLFLTGLDPLAHQVVLTFSPKEKPRQIIGVVRDVREGPLDSPVRPAIYFPMDQNPRTFVNLAVRTAYRPESAITAVLSVIHQIDPDSVTLGIQTMDDRIRRSPAAFLHRYPAWLATVFAALALLLGSIGLYGLVAYSVSQRTQEIGIRMALGAQRRNVLTLVLTQGLRLIVPGVLIGTVAAFIGGYLLRSQLFAVSAADPLIFAVVTIALAAVTLFACYIPARQAARVDPMVALRYE